MPTYILKFSKFKINKNKRDLLARGITKIHSNVTGANSYFAQVIFQKNENNFHYMGGKPINSKEIFLHGHIRGGRTSLIKKNLIKKLRDFIVKNLNLSKDSVWVYISELEPEQMIEYGEILPPSGQEKRWFNQLPKKLKTKLLKLDF
tara:strand:+ start:799 stop:1239 length:441 start_codon:yes stop_codon:yes gene_type:complete